MRIVGSMTTLPDRINSLYTPIKKIMIQSEPLDALYINIPLKTLKGLKYNLPDDFLDCFSGYKTKIIINRCKKDYGPITKLVPTLYKEKDPETYIITFDDDIIVHKNIVKSMKKKIKKYPSSCLGYSGVCIGTFPFYYQYAVINKEDIYIDWIQGVHTVLYKRSFFPDIKKLITFGDDTVYKKSFLFNDDHRISMYLASINISRISIGYSIQDYLSVYKSGQKDALSSRRLDLIKEHYDLINYGKSKGYYNKTYKYNISIGFYIIYFIINLILLILFIINKKYYYTIIIIIINLLFIKTSINNLFI